MRQCADLLIAKTEQKTLANLCTVTSEQVPERYKTQWLFRSCRREPRRQPEKALKLTLCVQRRGQSGAPKPGRLAQPVATLPEAQAPQGPGPAGKGRTQLAEDHRAFAGHRKGSRPREAKGGDVMGVRAFSPPEVGSHRELQNTRTHGKKRETCRHTVTFPPLLR